ncbi:hypothetical protein RB195_021093 [Necator americanus]|uniref:Uncharacterized protein n=1 Tax=Necator americanus TaxID=51031 RepID=A0ABR1E9C8_NECAM
MRRPHNGLRPLAPRRSLQLCAPPAITIVEPVTPPIPCPIIASEIPVCSFGYSSSLFAALDYNNLTRKSRTCCTCYLFWRPLGNQA